MTASKSEMSCCTLTSATLVLLALGYAWRTEGAAVFHEEPYITLARCRIQCILKFLLDPVHHADDNHCRDTNNYRTTYNRNCSQCWQMCLSLPTGHQNGCGATSSSVSDKGSNLGNRWLYKGEKTACDFVFSHRKAPSRTLQGDWTFQKEVEYTVENLEMKLSWQPPTSISPSSREVVAYPGPLVYVLLSRPSEEHVEEWTLIDQVVSTKVRVDVNSVPILPEIWLKAVSEHGLIAETKFKPTSSEKQEVIHDPSDQMLEKLHKSSFPSWFPEKLKDMTADITFDRKKVKGAEGSHYIQEAQVTFRGPGGLDPQRIQVYTVVWVFIECDTDQDLPCRGIRDSFSATAEARGGQQGNYTIRDLYFNSIYKLSISLHYGLSNAKVEIAFKTERCSHLDNLVPYHCLDDIEEDQLPVVPVLGLPQLEEEKPRLFVNISSMVTEIDSDLVLVNVTWHPVANQTELSYNITTFVENRNGMAVDMFVTSHPFVVLRLQQDTQYVVKVETKLVSGDEDHNIITEMLQFNTSELPSYQEPVAYRLLNDDDITQMNGIIIGVTCFVIILVLSSLAAVLYKKRKSFKDIIVTKATVAKSNSYKSNVGGKSDYSNQLIVFSDEWELSPQKLKFSTLLGQGAFGKVVTGYYDDQKVAIKLVREGAPISYKEDLVAEIHLMKRIGNHPNIVCLIGACTLTEPIALVMEYVPYGNLQNFLKKCRLEGDLRKRADGTSELTYAMVQDCGEIENGVVTPADMLSFARQVSMAMEYLSEKKYVHRDLAARNVLIHYNKVVKVCDFGLSRDIFNDNHYKKLTNGKLPLKWMAIESLRDRIFTTQSDVWSFGILLWEIVTMGASPYPNVALADLYFVLSTGYRMDKPSNCSDELYAIMRSCWEDESTDRPTFTQLRFMLEELLTEDRDYLVLEDIDVPISNSDNSSNPLSASAERAAMCSLELEGGAMSMPYPIMPVSPVAPSSPTASHPVKIPKKATPRRDHMRINVCVHQKSTDRLIRPSESDSSPSSC